MTKHITLVELIEIHELVVKRTGGATGIRDLGRLEAVVATQHQAVFGKTLYPNIWARAAAMVRGIIADHPFIDGNKRTGMLVGLTLLEINDSKTSFKKGEIEDFAVKVATEHLEVPVIAKWLKKHSTGQ